MISTWVIARLPSSRRSNRFRRSFFEVAGGTQLARLESRRSLMRVRERGCRRGSREAEKMRSPFRTLGSTSEDCKDKGFRGRAALQRQSSPRKHNIY